jgi:hypothetical protein
MAAIGNCRGVHLKEKQLLTPNPNSIAQKICFPPDAYPIAGFYLYVRPALHAEMIIAETPTVNGVVLRAPSVSPPVTLNPRGSHIAPSNLEPARSLSFQHGAERSAAETTWRDVSTLRLNGQTKELFIVEAKQRHPDFEEGTSQLMLYYAQAKYYSRFKDWQIHLALVTSKPQPTPGYELWQQWMRSEKRLSTFAADAVG